MKILVGLFSFIPFLVILCSIGFLTRVLTSISILLLFFIVNSICSLIDNIKERINKINCYILSDQVWSCNVKQFLRYSKNCIFKFMEVNSWHHKLFHFYLSFWIWKVWKGSGKITNLILNLISWERTELFNWIEKYFLFLKGYDLVKNKI